MRKIIFSEKNESLWGLLGPTMGNLHLLLSCSSRYMEYIEERGSIAHEHELSETVMWLSWQSVFLACPKPLESVPSTE